MVMSRVAGTRSSVGLPFSSFFSTPTLSPAHLGDVLGDRLGEIELAVLPQHHGRHRRDGLAHGVDAEDGVLRHRHLGSGIARAYRLEEGDLAVTGDQHHRPGNDPLVHVRLYHVYHPLQALRRKSDLFWLGAGPAMYELSHRDADVEH